MSDKITSGYILEHPDMTEMDWISSCIFRINTSINVSYGILDWKLGFSKPNRTLKSLAQKALEKMQGLKITQMSC